MLARGIVVGSRKRPSGTRRARGVVSAGRAFAEAFSGHARLDSLTEAGCIPWRLGVLTRSAVGAFDGLGTAAVLARRTVNAR